MAKSQPIKDLKIVEEMKQYFRDKKNGETMHFLLWD